MIEVKVAVSINAEDANQVAALNLFLSAIGGNSLAAPSEVIKTPVKDINSTLDEAADKKAADEKATAKKEAAAKKVADKKAAAAKKAADEKAAKVEAAKKLLAEAEGDEPGFEDEPATSKDGTPTLDDVRELVTAKVITHRTEVKTKLTELGANNVSGLKESDYAEMFAYLESLK